MSVSRLHGPGFRRSPSLPSCHPEEASYISGTGARRIEICSLPLLPPCPAWQKGEKLHRFREGIRHKKTCLGTPRRIETTPSYLAICRESPDSLGLAFTHLRSPLPGRTLHLHTYLDVPAGYLHPSSCMRPAEPQIRRHQRLTESNRACARPTGPWLSPKWLSNNESHSGVRIPRGPHGSLRARAPQSRHRRVRLPSLTTRIGGRRVTNTPSIVFVAGIGGHPVNTWLYTPPPPIPSEPPRAPRRTRSFRSRPSKLLVKQPSLGRSPSASNLHRSQKLRDEDQSASKLENGGIGDGEGVYWPLDLLPRSCPEARVLTWGCGDAALGRRRGARGDVLSLADGLLRELTLRRKETRTARRPIVFVAHSLGGIIVKEVSFPHPPRLSLSLSTSQPVIDKQSQGTQFTNTHKKALRRSEAAHGPSRSLLPSISAVLFLACPHRSTELGSLADAVRSAAGQCLGESDKDYALRRSMGLTVEERKGLEGLEAGREAFERLWRDWNFGIACFREGRGEGAGYVSSLLLVCISWGG